MSKWWQVACPKARKIGSFIFLILNVKNYIERLTYDKKLEKEAYSFDVINASSLLNFEDLSIILNIA